MGKPEEDRQILANYKRVKEDLRREEILYPGVDIRERQKQAAEAADAARERMSIREEFGIDGAMGGFYDPDLTDDPDNIEPEPVKPDAGGDKPPPSKIIR